MAHKNVSSVKTIDRMVEILDRFSPEHPTWSLAELSSALEFPKSTLHRFLIGLECHGILRRDRGEKVWRLGYRLLAWGAFASEGTELKHIARPVMLDLVKASSETAILTIYHDQEVICLDTVESSHPIRLTLTVGAHRPPHGGASSKVLMAYLPEDEIQVIIRDRGLPKLCTNTITDPTELLLELARIRERGFAYSVEETDVSAWGIATPVFNRNGRAVAGLGVAGPTYRWTDAMLERYSALCQQAAQRISILLYSGAEAGS
jgi:IclR family KDG regulon transcriptional repressor